jgi:uncharacterized protein (TIGR04255 family)
MIEEDLAYPNAPIIEAVIDFRVAARDGLTVEDLLLVTECLKPEYPEVVPLTRGTAQIDVGQQQLSTIEIVPMGYTCQTARKDWIYQAQLGGLSVSRLRPYTHWPELRKEAQHVWDKYSNVVRPTAINRVGLRYINRIDIPQTTIDLEEYFGTYVRISPDISAGINHFYFQVQIPQEDIASVCIINCAGLPPPKPDTLSILFDIDLFTDVSVNLAADDAWSLLETMRKRKNTIFEASITDRTRELFR